MALFNFSLGSIIGNERLPVVNPPNRWNQQETFMSAVERQRRQDMLFLTAGVSTPRVKFTFLTPLQKTAYAYWRDTTDLEFPGAKPIEIEILRELRRLNAGR